VGYDMNNQVCARFDVWMVLLYVCDEGISVCGMRVGPACKWCRISVGLLPLLVGWVQNVGTMFFLPF
jgi:hypothetical protein